jgi:hypothetical protein
VRDYLHAGPDFAASYRAIWRHDLHASAREAGRVDLLLAGARDRIRHMHERAVTAIPHRAAQVLPDATDFVAEQDPAEFCRVVGAAIGDNTGKGA